MCLKFHLKKELTREFKIKDLSLRRYFLGMEVGCSTTSIVVTQRKYTLNLLKEVGMLGCKPTEVPIDPNHKISLVESGKSVSIRGDIKDLWKS